MGDPKQALYGVSEQNRGDFCPFRSAIAVFPCKPGEGVAKEVRGAMESYRKQLWFAPSDVGRI